MTVKDFHNASRYASNKPRHRVLSREPAGHAVATTMLAVACVAAVFGVLWLLYAFG